MKNVIIILMIFIFGTLFNSCQKDRFQRLPEGEYDFVATLQGGDYISINPFDRISVQI